MAVSEFWDKGHCGTQRWHHAVRRGRPGFRELFVVLHESLGIASTRSAAVSSIVAIATPGVTKKLGDVLSLFRCFCVSFLNPEPLNPEPLRIK